MPAPPVVTLLVAVAALSAPADLPGSTRSAGLATSATAPGCRAAPAPGSR